MSDGQLNRSRVEEKFIISKDEFAKVLSQVKAHLSLYRYSESDTSKYTDISSVYFDSPDLHFFQLHADDEPKRAKIRLRRYAPDGHSTSDRFIEIKEKNNGDHKTRIQLDPSSCRLVNRGYGIILTPGLEKMNSDMPKDELKTALKRVNGFISANDCLPRLEVSYRRVAYGDDNFRITFDTDLTYKVVGAVQSRNAAFGCDMNNAEKIASRYGSGDVIMEVKYHEQGPPAWTQKIMQQFESLSFSKYAYCCFKAIT